MMSLIAAKSSFSNGSAAPRRRTAPSAMVSLAGRKAGMHSNNSFIVGQSELATSQGWSARESLLAGGFPVEQSAPAFDAPGIFRERAIVADHTMAGNGDGEIVRGARSGDRTCRPRGPNTPRDLGIADRLADPNLPQRLPNTLLEGRAADIKGKVEADRGCFDEADDPRDQCLIVAIATNETRFRKTILEIADELVRIFSQQNGGDSRLARGDKHGAKGGLSDRELDLLVRAPSAIP